MFRYTNSRWRENCNNNHCVITYFGWDCNSMQKNGRFLINWLLQCNGVIFLHVEIMRVVFGLSAASVFLKMLIEILVLRKVFAQYCAVKKASTSTANASAIPGGKARSAICDMTSVRYPTATVMVIVRTESVFARSVSKGNSVPKVSGFMHKTRTLTTYVYLWLQIVFCVFRLIKCFKSNTCNYMCFSLIPSPPL